MGESTIRVKNLNEVTRALQKFGIAVSDLKAAFKRIGSIVVAEAKSLVPIRSGKLASTIRPSNTKNKSVIRAGSAGAVYAGVIHWGGYHNIKPNQFLTNAVDRKHDEVIGAIDQELNKLIADFNN